MIIALIFFIIVAIIIAFAFTGANVLCISPFSSFFFLSPSLSYSIICISNNISIIDLIVIISDSVELFTNRYSCIYDSIDYVTTIASPLAVITISCLLFS